MYRGVVASVAWPARCMRVLAGKRAQEVIKPDWSPFRGLEIFEQGRLETHRCCMYSSGGQRCRWSLKCMVLKALCFQVYALSSSIPVLPTR